MKAVNPATEEVIHDYAEHGEAKVEDRLQRAGQAFTSWRRNTLAERADLLRRAARRLSGRRAEYREEPADWNPDLYAGFLLSLFVVPRTPSSGPSSAE